MSERVEGRVFTCEPSYHQGAKNTALSDWALLRGISCSEAGQADGRLQLMQRAASEGCETPSEAG